jgi:hypothetical protein
MLFLDADKHGNDRGRETRKAQNVFESSTLSARPVFFAVELPSSTLIYVITQW